MMTIGTLKSFTESIEFCDTELRQRRERSVVSLEDLIYGRDLSSATPDELASMRSQ